MLDKLVLHPTSMAQWQSLVQEAGRSSNVSLSEELENYLVFLLMRHIQNPEIVKSIVASSFLKSLETIGKERQYLLREVGDTCLLLSGLFPNNARKKNVRISYYVEIGKSAYFTLSNCCGNQLSNLFETLDTQFISLMDLLLTMRTLDNKTLSLDLLEAEELWQDTNSTHALKTLKQKIQQLTIHDLQSFPQQRH